MTYFYWITGIILALAWVSRIVDASLGMPSVADVSKPDWDRNPVSPSGNPRLSIIVPARNEEQTIEKALRPLLARQNPPRLRHGVLQRGQRVLHGSHVQTLCLETRNELREAIALYLSSGYREVPPFNDEPYADRWFEKAV